MRLREALDQIDDILLRYHQENSEGDPQFKKDTSVQAHLAFVLRALRGPDDQDAALKFRTTQRIRRAAFPKAAFTLGCDNEGRINVKDIPQDHFGSSVMSAAVALEILDPFPEGEDHEPR